MAQHLFYAEDFTENDGRIFLNLEHVTARSVAAITKQNESQEVVDIETAQVRLDLPDRKEKIFTILEDIKPFTDRFLLLETDRPKIEDILKASYGGRHPLAYKIRNGIRRHNRNFMSQAVAQPKQEVRRRRGWFFYAMNVGEGDCSIIVSPELKTFIFDFGYRNAHMYKKLDILWDFLKDMGLKIKREISGICISHPDSDHFGGLIDCLNNVRLSEDCRLLYNYMSLHGGPRWLVAQKRLSLEIAARRLGVMLLPSTRSRLPFTFVPGIDNQYLWPHTDCGYRFSVSRVKSNDSSIAMTFGHRSKLNIVGDVEGFAWSEIFARHPNLHSSLDIFKYSHHGRSSANYMTPTLNLNQNASLSSTFSVASTRLQKSPPLCPSVQNGYKTSTAANGFLFEINGGSITRRCL